MTLLRSWLLQLLHPHTEVDRARERVLRDRHRVELHAERIERSADELASRVARNHISASVEALWRRTR